jgi:hypothetical protein
MQTCWHWVLFLLVLVWGSTIQGQETTEPAMVEIRIPLRLTHDLILQCNSYNVCAVIEELETRVMTLETQIALMQAQLASLLATSGQTTTRVTWLQNNVTSQSNSISTLQSTTSSQSSSISSLQTSVTALQIPTGTVSKGNSVLETPVLTSLCTDTHVSRRVWLS